MSLRIDYFDLIDKNVNEFKSDLRLLFSKSNKCKQFLYYIIKEDYVRNYLIYRLDSITEFESIKKHSTKKLLEYSIIEQLLSSKNLIELLNYYNTNDNLKLFINNLVGENIYLNQYANHLYKKTQPQNEHIKKEKINQKRKLEDKQVDNQDKKIKLTKISYKSTRQTICGCCKIKGYNSKSCGKHRGHPCEKCKLKYYKKINSIDDDDDDDPYNYENTKITNLEKRTKLPRNKKKIAEKNIKKIIKSE